MRWELRKVKKDELLKLKVHYPQNIFKISIAVGKWFDDRPMSCIADEIPDDGDFYMIVDRDYRIPKAICDSRMGKQTAALFNAKSVGYHGTTKETIILQQFNTGIGALSTYWEIMRIEYCKNSHTGFEKPVFCK